MSDRTYEAGAIIYHLPSEFKSRCCEKLEDLGDTEMNTRDNAKAISHYSAALALDPVVPQGLFIKRSKAYITRGSWEDALNDANKVCSFVSRRPVLVVILSPGDRARSIVSMGLREEACCVTQGRRL